MHVNIQQREYLELIHTTVPAVKLSAHCNFFYQYYLQ